MKYSREQVKSMTQLEYIKAVCDELEGYETYAEDFGIKYNQNNYKEAIMQNNLALYHLKVVGLVNNGKCPLCGIREDDIRYRLHHFQSDSDYHVCKSCFKKYSGKKYVPIVYSCCLGIIVLFFCFVWIIISTIK